MNSLYDKLAETEYNVLYKNRQLLYDIVKEHFNYNKTDISKWLRHITNQLLFIFKKNNTCNAFYDSNLKDVIDNYCDIDDGNLNIYVLNVIIGIAASTTPIIELCFEENIFEKQIINFKILLEKSKNQTDIFLLEQYFLYKIFNKKETLNAASLLLLTLPNLNYYLEKIGYEIKRSQRKSLQRTYTRKFKHSRYTYVEINTKTKKLSKNQPQKIIFDYLYSEQIDTTERKSYYAY